MKLAAVIFDLDGTVLLSEEASAKSAGMKVIALTSFYAKEVKSVINKSIH